MQADLPLPDDDARAHSERLEAFIRNEIAAEGGSIPFSRFMECSPYAPRCSSPARARTGCTP